MATNSTSTPELFEEYKQAKVKLIVVLRNGKERHGKCIDVGSDFIKLQNDRDPSIVYLISIKDIIETICFEVDL